jgi:hypothetical protein
MTQEQKELFETSISMVHNSLSSIFTEQDVVKVLTDLQRSFTELPEVATTGFTKEHIIDSVRELLYEYPFSDHVACEPELNGSYGDSYSLEMNTSFEEDDFIRSFVTELEDYFTPNNQNNDSEKN